MSVNAFAYDVFLSYSSKDKAVVRPLAERPKADGLRVWLDAWEIRANHEVLMPTYPHDQGQISHLAW